LFYAKTLKEGREGTSFLKIVNFKYFLAGGEEVD